MSTRRDGIRNRVWLVPVNCRFAFILLFPVWVVLVFLLTAQGRSVDEWLAGWDHWDSYWYEYTWENGYPRADPRNLVYPPGYSHLVGGLSTVTGLDFQRTALVINCLSFWATAMLFCAVASRRFDLPHRSILLVCFLSSPASFFCFPAYSDALFNLLAWSLIALAFIDIESQSGRRALIVRVSRPVLAFALPWIRLTGYAFVSWIVLRKWYVLPILLTLALWMALNWAITGDPLYFYRATELFAMPAGGFFDGLSSTWHRLISGPDANLHDGLQLWMANNVLPAIYLIAVTATALWLLWKNESLLAVTTLAILVLSHNGAHWRSTVRYDWPLTPLLFLPLLCGAYRGRTRWYRWGATLAIVLLLAVQYCLQIWYARAFLAGRWAF